MNDVVEKLKRLPPMTSQVCGSCKFYISRRNNAFGGLCDAVGGTYAADAWKKCQGNLWWQPRITAYQRFKYWLRS